MAMKMVGESVGIWQRLMEYLGLSLPVDQEEQEEKKERWENPYLPWLREILNKILIQRGSSYKDMRLAVVDSISQLPDIFWEDPVMTSLEQLSGDLNYLVIFTGRPAYFQEYLETMYQEHGLVVQLITATVTERTLRAEGINTLLDFRRDGSLGPMPQNPPALYLPIYKKSWEQGENLDICVPIGYNTVIVKGIYN